MPENLLMKNKKKKILSSRFVVEYYQGRNCSYVILIKLMRLTVIVSA